MNKHDFEVVKAEEIISGYRKSGELTRAVITIEGSELARGGRGARCMSMPVRRRKVEW